MLKTQLIGRIGGDATVNNVNGKNVINFTVAHSERYKDSQGNQQEKTIWVDCAYWTERTAVAPYLLKGVLVYVDGQPEAKAYTKKDGSAGVSLLLRVREVQLLGSKNDNQQQNQQPQQRQSVVSGPATGFDDDNEPLPF